MKFNLLDVAESSVFALKVLVFYCLFLWFLGVGLASGVVLTQLVMPIDGYMIGNLILTLTMLLPFQFLAYISLSRLLNITKSKKNCKRGLKCVS